MTAAAWERMLASMRKAFAVTPRTSAGGRAVHLDGVVASVAPAVPERSVPNSVTYESEEALADALGELRELYDEAGVLAWTVWVPEHHARAAELLERSGHRLDGVPTAMIAELRDVEPPRATDPEPDPEPTREDIGRVNDLAYGTGDSFQRLMGEGPAPREHAYVSRVDGQAAACLATIDLDGDCSVWWVATAPEARGRGLAPGLLRHALAEGRARGCDVSTLQATGMGRPVYERLGYRGFGTVQMWERRKAG